MGPFSEGEAQVRVPSMQVLQLVVAGDIATRMLLLACPRSLFQRTDGDQDGFISQGEAFQLAQRSGRGQQCMAHLISLCGICRSRPAQLGDGLEDVRRTR